MTTPTVQRIAAFSLTSRDAGRLGEFYQAAFDCRLQNSDRLEGAEFEALMLVEGGAHRMMLELGREIIQILEFDNPGRPYPEPLSPIDNGFQHLALVVTDIDAAWRRLSSFSGWTAMTTGGPQRLPPSTGNVKAFKFRDPEGHPLEFLEFPADSRPVYWNKTSSGLFLGIDHSALSVSDVHASVSFYQTLGLRVAARTLNHGPEQERLDGIIDPQVDVIALEPFVATPHVELLHYRTTASRHPVTLRSNDLAATRLVVDAGSQSRAALLRDPDGHLIELASGNR